MSETFRKDVDKEGNPVIRITHTSDRVLSKSELEQEKASLLKEIDALQARVNEIDEMLALL